MTPTPFDTLPDGRTVDRVTLRAGNITANVITWGATVQDLIFDGQRVVVGADTVDAYLNELLYAGAIVGRFANRIGGAKFDLDGATHHTDANEPGGHTLHGGSTGTGDMLWTLDDATTDSARLTLTLADGHMGFPGEMAVAATYTLEAPGTLRVDIEARTTKATPCNFAHHGYFVLDNSGGITGHDLTVQAAHYLPVDDDLIPTGNVAPVQGTAFDFQTPRAIGTAEYDHNFCLDGPPGAIRPVARLESALSGIALDVETAEPGLQIYDGRHLAGAPGHGDTRYHANAGLAMETQGWPDSPNQPGFPQSILRPGDVYRTTTRYRFSRRT